MFSNNCIFQKCRLIIWKCKFVIFFFRHHTICCIHDRCRVIILIYAGFFTFLENERNKDWCIGLAVILLGCLPLALVAADSRSLVVVVDTNRPDQVVAEQLLLSCNKVAVIDHHRRAASYIQNAALTFLERKRPTERQDVDWITRQESKLIRGLEYMAEQLGEHAWCMGTHFSLADIAAVCALGYLAFRFPEIDWSEKHPNLARLYSKLMLRPSFAATVPQG